MEMVCAGKEGTAEESEGELWDTGGKERERERNVNRERRIERNGKSHWWKRKRKCLV